MNLHEYQAKEQLKKYNVPLQNGVACTTVDEAVAAYNDTASRTGTKFVVIKAQIHAGGRGKGTFIEVPMQHGVQVAKSEDDARTIATNMLGNTLVTLQTGDAGKVVSKIFIAEDAYYEGVSPIKEFYLSVLLDRTRKQNVIMYSQDGGMNIEDVAHNTPERIFPAGFSITRIPSAQHRIQPRFNW